MEASRGAATADQEQVWDARDWSLTWRRDEGELCGDSDIHRPVGASGTTAAYEVHLFLYFISNP